MTASSAPNVAQDVVRIHRVITRGLDVTIRHAKSFARDGYPDSPTGEGFVSYVQALASVLHAHHLTEDEAAFPYFREKLPDAPYDLLIAEHRQMAGILEEIKPTIDGLTADAGPRDSLGELKQGFSRVAEIWRPHIQREEEHITAQKLETLIDAEEQVRLTRMFALHTQEHSGPDYLVVPFILYNLPPEDRAVMSRAMPPVVTQQLVPVAWKENWAPMRPFLLR